FAFLILLLAADFSVAQDSQPFSTDTSSLPAPTGFVNDYAGVIDAATKQQLEQKLKAFKERTNPQVELAVAVVKTTGDRDIFEYSLAVSRGWKIGSKNDDNPSALLFVAIQDRKYFTQVSRDLEDELPDGAVGSLQRQYLVPEFKKGNYAKGISDTIDAYIATIDAKTTGNPTPTPKSGSGNINTDGGGSIFSIICCLIVIVVILLIVFSRGSRGGPTSGDRSRWGGGGFGGSALPWIVGGILGSGGGSNGGSDWGGSSGGGGSDWGGFGGGGDFGGGGSGGSW
ncbi:MAG: TPM domain-containing protein, partial [Acidobacteriota bacterium]